VLIGPHKKLCSVVFLLALALNGCGQTGPLILSSTPTEQLETPVTETELEEKQKLAEGASNNDC